MLLQFVVENYLSFKDETVFSLVPASGQQHHDHILRQKAGKSVDALPIAGFYGANASGKSNLIKAISFAQYLVNLGTSKDQSIGRSCFKLDKGCREKPSRFEFIFSNDGVLYTYNFSVSDKEVLKEQLFAYYSSKASLLFDRNNEEKAVVINIGPNISEDKEEKKLLKVLASGTLPNQLYLSEVSKKAFVRLDPVVDWFRNRLVIIKPEAHYGPLFFELHSNISFKDLFETSLKLADTGITGISVSEQVFDLGKESAGLSDEGINEILAEIRKIPDGGISIRDDKIGQTFHLKYDETGSGLHALKVNTIHKMTDGSDIPFELNEESDGTVRWMDLVPILSKFGFTDKTFLVDELDRSLHPLLCRQLVRLFLYSNMHLEGHNQLVFTTHDSNLLDPDIFRHDEIYFVEKDSAGASHLTSLAEYRIRNDLKIDKGYLNGRFGAIPILGDFILLFEHDDNEPEKTKKTS